MYKKYIIFEYDAVKSETNLRKHGIDFKEGQLIWADPDLIFDVPDTLKLGEQYRLCLGRVRGKLWTAIYTKSADKIRTVSIRRSREEEEKVYESCKDG